jgi:carbamoyl-phosphate synthase large subunit
VATAGTAAALRHHGYPVRHVARLGEDDPELPNIIDVIASGEISLIVNTPTPRAGTDLDAAAIRHAAIAEGVLCMTTMDTAIAAAHALEPSAQARIGDVRSLDSWLGNGRASG